MDTTVEADRIVCTLLIIVPFLKAAQIKKPGADIFTDTAMVDLVLDTLKGIGRVGFRVKSEYFAVNTVPAAMLFLHPVWQGFSKFDIPGHATELLQLSLQLIQNTDRELHTKTLHELPSQVDMYL